MSRFYVPLPAPEIRNAMVDTSTLNQAADQWNRTRQHNAMAAYRRERDQVADQRYASETSYRHGRDAIGDQRYADETAYNRGRQGVQDQRAAESHGWDREEQQNKKRQLALDAMAGLAQTIMESPEELRAARYQQFRQAIPDFDADMTAAGFDPNNWEAALPAIVARSRGYVDPAKGGKYGVNPVYGVDSEGRPVVMQLGNDGSVKQPQLPEGVTPLGPGEQAAARARGAATGKSRGQAQAELAGVVQSANQSLAMLTSLENDPYLERMLGPIDSRTPDWSSDAGRVASKIDQIQGSAFLTAFESLKGGGHITEIEGHKATQAISRLAQRNMRPEDYRQAINELRQIILNGVLRARVDAGELPQEALGDLRNYGGSTGSGSGPQPGAVEDGYRFKGGDPADPNSWEPVR